MQESISKFREIHLTNSPSPGSVLSSATDLFLAYREVLDQCFAMSSGALVQDLTKVLEKNLKRYADDVLAGILTRCVASLVGMRSRQGILNPNSDILAQQLQRAPIGTQWL